MSMVTLGRPTLSLFELDRTALKGFSAELKSLLLADDRAGLCEVLELSDAAAKVCFDDVGRMVDAMLMDETTHQVLFASLRRITKKRALSKVMASENPALEGRMRAFEVLRNVPDMAKRLDKLLNIKRLPWYLKRTQATGGWLPDADRKALVAEMKPLRRALTDELVELLDGLDEAEGDVLMHDAL